MIMAETVLISRRQKDVMVLAAKGLSAKQIAAVLFITIPTVEKRKRLCFEKIGALNITHAIAILKDRGII